MDIASPVKYTCKGEKEKRFGLKERNRLCDAHLEAAPEGDMELQHHHVPFVGNVDVR